MGTRSYVVQGKDKPVALNSAPHGASRNYSRSAARTAFTPDDLRAAMAGIEYADTAASSAAYKDIDQVMATRSTSSKFGTSCGRSSTSRATDRGA
ncbi:RtcB family protein [Microlunatus sp. GCM10028923]|uniref:RtcB family protein n=1 Tax=Microlunatus sp. GCM10028923 TaxID=3273400 RepID=UPI0036205A6F